MIEYTKIAEQAEGATIFEFDRLILRLQEMREKKLVAMAKERSRKLSSVDDIKAAVEAGETVHWGNASYKVIKDSLGQWLVFCASTNYCWGLTDSRGNLNGKHEDFYIA